MLDAPRASSLYRSAPQLDVDQAWFWNAVVVGGWPGTPWSLLERLQVLECQAGRRRDPGRPKGPRVLDLDLLLAGSEVATLRLTLPHPGLRERRFVLEPLLEVEPGADARGDLAEALAGLASQAVERCPGTW